MGNSVQQDLLFIDKEELKIHPGNNVGRGGDDTLFATVDGIVKFERLGRDRKQVSVYPAA